jgi:hypothetical protein
MSYQTENVDLLFPITEDNRKQALALAKQQVAEDKVQQVYCNTLAILLVEHYLEMLDVEVDRSKSYCWDDLTRFTSNIADLYIPEARGRLECRPIRPGEQQCVVPEELLDQESWSDRIGCVVVELNDEFTVGILRGFVPVLDTEALPLSHLRSLDDLIDRINTPNVVDIRDFSRKVFQVGWQPVNRLTRRPRMLAAPASLGEVLDSATLQYLIEGFYAEDNRALPVTTPAQFHPQDTLMSLIQVTESETIRFKAAELLFQIDPTYPNMPIVAAKREVSLLLQGQAIDLIVCVLPKPDSNYLICARLESREGLLPADITLTGIDNESATVFFQEPNTSPNREATFIQHLFIVHPGDLFSLRVSLNDAQITENFIV